MRFLRNVPSTTSTKSEFYFQRKPEKIPKWEAVRKYLFNWEEGTACNRSAKSWCLLLIFYVSFLLIINGVFFSLLFGAVATIDFFTKGALHNVSAIKNPLPDYFLFYFVHFKSEISEMWSDGNTMLGRAVCWFSSSKEGNGTTWTTSKFFDS